MIEEILRSGVVTAFSVLGPYVKSGVINLKGNETFDFNSASTSSSNSSVNCELIVVSYVKTKDDKDVASKEIVLKTDVKVDLKTIDTIVFDSKVHSLSRYDSIDGYLHNMIVMEVL
jgi:hypothetical protein